MRLRAADCSGPLRHLPRPALGCSERLLRAALGCSGRLPRAATCSGLLHLLREAACSGHLQHLSRLLPKPKTTKRQNL